MRFIGTVLILTCVYWTISSVAAETRHDPTGADSFDGCNLRRGPTHSVVAVKDSETLQLDDGTIVRLIGAMTPRKPLISIAKKLNRTGSKASVVQPRTVHNSSNAWPMVRAAEAYVSMLALGRSVTLWTSGRSSTLSLADFPRDRYGRVLAHVTTIAPRNTAHLTTATHENALSRPAIWLQAGLIRAGLARTYSATDARDCIPQLLRHEASARLERRNVWRQATNAVRRADRPAEMLKRMHTFQIVQGRVRKVARYRNTTYVNFGTHWRKDFTVIVEGRSHQFLRKLGLNLKDLEGQRLRVRGWIEARDGPMMRLTHPEQIELLEPNAKPARLFESGALAAFDELRTGTVEGNSTPFTSSKRTRSITRRSLRKTTPNTRKSRRKQKKKQQPTPIQKPANALRASEDLQVEFLSM